MHTSTLPSRIHLSFGYPWLVFEWPYRVMRTYDHDYQRKVFTSGFRVWVRRIWWYSDHMMMEWQWRRREGTQNYCSKWKILMFQPRVCDKVPKGKEHAITSKMDLGGQIHIALQHQYIKKNGVGKDKGISRRRSAPLPFPHTSLRIPLKCKCNMGMHKPTSICAFRSCP